MKLLHLNSGTKEECSFGECYHISNVFILCQVYWSLFCHLSLSVCRWKGVLSNHIVLETIQGGFAHYLPVTISWASSLLSDQKHSLIRDSVCHWDCPVQELPAVIWGILFISVSCAFLCGELLAHYTDSSPLMGFKLDRMRDTWQFFSISLTTNPWLPMLG